MNAESQSLGQIWGSGRFGMLSGVGGLAIQNLSWGGVSFVRLSPPPPMLVLSKPMACQSYGLQPGGLHQNNAKKDEVNPDSHKKEA